MLKYLLEQAHVQKESVLQEILPLYRSEKAFWGDKQNYWSVAELLKMIIAVAKSRSPMTCVLDGLDESEGGPERQQLVKELMRLALDDSERRLEFIALSRPSPDVTKELYANVSQSRHSVARSRGLNGVIMQDETKEARSGRRSYLRTSR